MNSSNYDIGKIGEKLAEEELDKNGYILIEKNYRSSFGEIDIIAKDCDVVSFVEIKARHSYEYGGPYVSITRKKKERIYKTALAYIKHRGKDLDESYRFDVVFIDLRRDGNNIEIIKDAFRVDEICS